MEIKVDHTPTPAELARAFCEMTAEQQTEFFTECQFIVKTEFVGGSAQIQAFGIKHDMPVGSPGADFLMDLAAPWYTHTLRYIDSHGERERA